MKTWMLVADGGTARVYRDTGNTQEHTVKLELVLGSEFTREKLDRNHSGSGDSKSFFTALGRAPHGVNTHEDKKRHAETKFLNSVVDWLSQSENQTMFEQLVIAAPARPLGELRAALPKPLAMKVCCEIEADLVKAPVKELEHRFLASIAAKPRLQG